MSSELVSTGNKAQGLINKIHVDYLEFFDFKIFFFLFVVLSDSAKHYFLELPMSLGKSHGLPTSHWVRNVLIFANETSTGVFYAY